MKLALAALILVLLSIPAHAQVGSGLGGAVVINCGLSSTTDCTTNINACLSTYSFCILPPPLVNIPIPCTALSWGSNLSGVLWKMPGAVLGCADPPESPGQRYTIDWTNENWTPQWMTNATLLSVPEVQTCTSNGSSCANLSILGLTLAESNTSGNCQAGQDVIWAYQSSHQAQICNNGGNSAPLIGGGGVAVGASSGSIGVTQTTIVARANPANTIQGGTAFLIKAEGTITDAAATSYTNNFYVNFGSTGTTSDSAILTVSPSSAASATSANFKLECRIVFKSVSTANANCWISPSATLLTGSLAPATAFSSTITGLTTTATSFIQLSYNTSNANMTGSFNVWTIDMEHP